MKDAAKKAGFELHNLYHFTHCAMLWLCERGEVQLSGNENDGWSGVLITEKGGRVFSGGGTYSECLCGLIHALEPK